MIYPFFSIGNIGNEKFLYYPILLSSAGQLSGCSVKIFLEGKMAIFINVTQTTPLAELNYAQKTTFLNRSASGLNPYGVYSRYGQYMGADGALLYSLEPTVEEPIPPTPTAKYKIQLSLLFQPKIPDKIYNLIENIIFKAGWYMYYLGYNNEGQLEIVVGQRSSVTLIVVVGLIIAALATITLIVINWRIKKVADDQVVISKSQEEIAGEATKYANEVLEALRQGIITSEQATEMLAGLTGAYQIPKVAPPTAIAELTPLLSIAVIGGLAIAAVGAFKKK